MRAKSVGCLAILIAASCETTPQPGDSSPPALALTIGDRRAISATEEITDECPSGSSRVPEALGKPIFMIPSPRTQRLTALATDRSGISAVEIYFNADWTGINNIEPPDAILNRDIVDSFHGLPLAQDAVLWTASGSLNTLAKVAFDIPVGAPNLIHVVVDDGAGLTTTKEVVIGHRSALCR